MTAEGTESRRKVMREMYELLYGTPDSSSSATPSPSSSSSVDGIAKTSSELPSGTWTGASRGVAKVVLKSGETPSQE